MQKTTVLLFLQILFVTSNSNFIVTPLHKFPFPVDNAFELKIILKIQSENIKSEFDSLIIGIVENNSINDRVIINYGKENSKKEGFFGNNMEIPKWEIDKNRKYVKINIFFKRNSHGKILKIFSFQASSEEDLIKVSRNLNLAKIIFTSKIELLIPSKLELSVKSVDTMMAELNEGDLVIATCRAYDGIPSRIPSFQNFRDFDVTRSLLNKKTNERQIWFRLSLMDHLKSLRCETENSVVSSIIYIPHHPTKIFLDPDVGQSVRPGTVIACYVKDGYPAANIRWQIIEGPKNVSKFYNIIGNGSKFKLNNYNKSGFKWKLKCSVESQVRKTKKMIEKLISFIIQETAIDNCDNACLHLRMTNLEKSNEEKNTLINKEILSLKFNIKNLTEQTNQNHNQLKNEIQKLKSDFQKRLTSLKQINIKTNGEFKQNIDKIKNDIKIFSTNKSNEINQMKISIMKSIKNLEKMKIQDNDSLNNSMQKLVSDLKSLENKQNLNIKDLKKEMIKEHQQLKTIIEMVKSKKTTPSIPNRKSKNSLPKRSQISYKINNLSIVRKTNQNLSSNDYLLNDLFTVNIQIWFRDLFNHNLLRDIEIFLSFRDKNNEDIKSTLKIKLTIEITNLNNSQLTKSLTKIFTIQTNENLTPSYNFNYEELSKIGVLLNDSIVINCLIIVF